MDHHQGSDSATGIGECGTYEATMARKSLHKQPDRIHWEKEAAFRDSPYRQLHHQKGLTGIFKVRLLEAADLERSYWSALALGPVKMLGLSTAHGPISSFCTFSLDAEPHNYNPLTNHEWTVLEGDGKMPANNNANSKMMDKTLSHPVVTSPVMPQDNNPVWSDFHFELPLRKGSLREDGMRIFVTVRVDEDIHVAEKFLPGMPKGDDRLIGRGKVDVTSLLLGETLLGQTQVGVLDIWVPIYYTNKDQEKIQEQKEQVAAVAAVAASAASAATHKSDPLKQPSTEKEVPKAPPKKQVGRVRVLLTYRPNGLTPQQNDVVALESYARRNPRRATCSPILPPLAPMTVKEVRFPYLLVEYKLPTTEGANVAHIGNNNNSDNKACMRLHRNAVFVIERKNIVDATVGWALLPADAIMSTPLGQTGAQIIGPAVNAGKEVLMPALLSFKLVFMALRTTAFASLSGVQAVGGHFWNEGANAWSNQNEESQYQREQQRARSHVSQL